MYMYMQGFPKRNKTFYKYSQFSKILWTSVILKGGNANNSENGYTVQGLLAKVKDNVSK